MNIYDVTIRYVTPSGVESCYREMGIPAESPFSATQEAKDNLLGSTPRRKVKAILGASCELYGASMD